MVLRFRHDANRYSTRAGKKRKPGSVSPGRGRKGGEKRREGVKERAPCRKRKKRYDIDRREQKRFE